MEERIDVDTGPQYQLEVEAFADAVLNDKEVPLRVDKETYANLEVMDAMRESAAENKIKRIKT
jgi:predicted dehydrogenase